MLRKLIQKIIHRLGILYTVELGLGSLFFITIIIFALQMLWPVKEVTGVSTGTFARQFRHAETPWDDYHKNDDDFRERIIKVRPGLFKAASGLSSKPMADKTIERIRSQLRLQCIMEIAGETAAYININNVGLKKCTVGETVHDLFTVISIGDKSVEISIIDHRVILSL